MKKIVLNKIDFVHALSVFFIFTILLVTPAKSMTKDEDTEDRKNICVSLAPVNQDKENASSATTAKSIIQNEIIEQDVSPTEYVAYKKLPESLFSKYPNHIQKDIFIRKNIFLLKEFLPDNLTEQVVSISTSPGERAQPLYLHGNPDGSMDYSTAGRINGTEWAFEPLIEEVGGLPPGPIFPNGVPGILIHAGQYYIKCFIYEGIQPSFASTFYLNCLPLEGKVNLKETTGHGSYWRVKHDNFGRYEIIYDGAEVQNLLRPPALGYLNDRGSTSTKHIVQLY